MDSRRVSDETVTIDYVGPDHATSEVRSRFARHEWLIPGWVQKLTVCVEAGQPEGSTSYAETAIDYNYRCGTITVYPMWFALDMADRDNTIIHELLHVLMSPLDGVYERCGLDKLKSAMLEDSTEQAVCDIAHAIQRNAMAVSA